jgi:hypothetical protein
MELSPGENHLPALPSQSFGSDLTVEYGSQKRRLAASATALFVMRRAFVDLGWGGA